MLTLNGAEWDQHVVDGETRSVRFVCAGVNAWNLEIRCPKPVILNAVSTDGLTLFLASGSVISFSAKMVDFAFFEVVSDTTFMYKSNARTRWYEVPDPTKLVVDVDESINKPISDLVLEEVKKLAGRYAAEGMLTSDVSIAEFLDDIENGDLDFEAEPDQFGLGFAEMEEQEPGRTTFKGEHQPNLAKQPLPAEPAPVEEVPSEGK